MVTGDNLVTSQAVAVKCNIITQAEMLGNSCMQGVDFRNKIGGIISCNNCGETMANCSCGPNCMEAVENPQAFKSMKSSLKVLSRCTPDDKYLLMACLKQPEYDGYSSFVGDGTNDAPALFKADAGFCMTSSGTEVAKQAADVLVVTDNFKPIVNAFIWGRNVFENI